MKILVATDKPFAAVAVEGIKKEVEAAGLELVLLEKYTEKASLLEAVKDVDGIIEGSPVRFMGIVIGHVRNLNYTPNAIQVEIIVTKKDVKIPSGSIASVEFTGLAGSKSIELYPPENDLYAPLFQAVGLTKRRKK